MSQSTVLADTLAGNLAGDQKCKVTIRTTGKGDGHTDVYSWGRFWEVAVALVGVCVAAGKEGVETRLGE